MLRRASLLLLLVGVPLAGCLGGGNGGDGTGLGVGDPCAWGLCLADPDAHPDWTLPEGATALWTFGDPYTSVDALVATDDGWAWTARRDGGTVVEAFDPDQGLLRSHALPPGHTVGQDRLAWDGEGLWFTHARPPDGDPVLIRWDPAAQNLTQWPLQGMDRRVAVTDPGPPVVLSAMSGSPNTQVYAFWTDRGVVPIGPDAPYTLAAAVEGRTLLRADATACSDCMGATLVLEDRVSGSTYELTTTNDTVAGVWGHDDRFAYATVDRDGAATLWGVDNRALSVQELAPGTRPWFTSEGVYTWVEEPGINPSVHFTPAGSDASSPLVFPASADVWAADGPELWWLEGPSTDPRFDEAPNPTDFVTVLYGLA